MTITPVVLAGGSGTRLWPLSRSLYPKQFMSLVDTPTLLQSTLLRLQALDGIAAPILLCNEAHRFVVAEQIRRMGLTPAAIVLEPAARNTAPALTVAALLAGTDETDPILLVLPADHHIRDVDGFVATVRKGAALAAEGRMVTFGITPDAPETGYGYIRKGSALNGDSPPAWAIDRFVEKPDRQTAQQYVNSGDYCWNSGMFMFRAGKLIEQMERHAPEIAAACRLAVARGRTDLDFFRLDKAAFAQSPSDSIDYAVMEKTDDGVMVALASDWSDLGSWEALWQAGTKDGQDNVIHGDVYLQDVHRSFVHASSRLVTAVGLDNHVVVETKDAVFVAPRHCVQQVKALVDRLKTDDRPETVDHRNVYRPWGGYEDIDVSERFLVKRITVKPGAQLSMQRHMHRAEHWVVVKGTALVTRGEEQFLLKEDQSTYIPLGTVHRLENPGKIPLELVEIQSGSYLAEDDVIRLDDVYGRHNGAAGNPSGKTEAAS
ncbi:mannose-1-phosphate guanylyltransferase/mannose-6-phosphate isomerase [Desulfatitalea alkaliphila]|uniref:mannose-1-phosphate guanylyltransferase n=1 Tax=Desulfatitalea alkaliphila TaxID=2929485 RepID=A0AA41R2B9_9BACT|nr:mannose-1-phosphate guanylyltransferase/mannose-6-phosphate isomerase [Desulfatitalea alkaliphila]MCJ8500436.1 mannose-1-phosphate guanylyltransferase/mannose-6-phosphate isomerase [Desulfatitalea alkaliphila]